MKHQELTMNLINEECLQAMQGIPDKSVDMILCDLPYGTTANYGLSMNVLLRTTEPLFYLLNHRLILNWRIHGYIYLDMNGFG